MYIGNYPDCCFAVVLYFTFLLYLHSFSESLVLSFLQSQEGLDLLEQNMGAIKLLLANIGEGK